MESKNILNQEFLQEDDLRKFIIDAFDAINEQVTGAIENVTREDFLETAISILKNKQAQKLSENGVIEEKPLRIKQTPGSLSREWGDLIDLESQLEVQMDFSENTAEKYVGIFRDKVLISSEEPQDPKSIVALIVSFARGKERKTWTLSELRSFEKTQSMYRVRNFFERNLSQGDTVSNLHFFFTEKKAAFEKELGESEFENFITSFEWKKAEKTTDEIKKEARKRFLEEQNSPWRSKDMVNYVYNEKTPLRHLEKDILMIMKEKKCSKFKAYKRHFKFKRLSLEQKAGLNLFVGKWGDWEQEGRFLTHFLETNPGEFQFLDILRLTIGGDGIGGALYKGIFKNLFPEAQKKGFKGKEWSYIFAHLINKGNLDLGLFLKNPFKMRAEKEEVFRSQLKRSIINNGIHKAVLSDDKETLEAFLLFDPKGTPAQILLAENQEEVPNEFRKKAAMRNNLVLFLEEILLTKEYWSVHKMREVSYGGNLTDKFLGITDKEELKKEMKKLLQSDEVFKANLWRDEFDNVFELFDPKGKEQTQKIVLEKRREGMRKGLVLFLEHVLQTNKYWSARNMTTFLFGDRLCKKFIKITDSEELKREMKKLLQSNEFFETDLWRDEFDKAFPLFDPKGTNRMRQPKLRSNNPKLVENKTMRDEKMPKVQTPSVSAKTKNIPKKKTPVKQNTEAEEVLQTIKGLKTYYKQRLNGNKNPFHKLRESGININEYLSNPTIKEAYQKVFSLYKKTMGNTEVLKIRRKEKKEMVGIVSNCMKQLKPVEQRGIILTCSGILNESETLRSFVSDVKESLHNMDFDRFITTLSVTEDRFVRKFCTFVENRYEEKIDV